MKKVGYRVMPVRIDSDKYIKFYRAAFAASMAIWHEKNPHDPLPRAWFDWAGPIKAHTLWVKFSLILNSASFRHEKPKTKREVSRDFYASRAWRDARFNTLRNSRGKCCLCGRGAGEGVILHVDHIKPRSRYPHLALDPNNLQVLCADCNLGKMNRSEDDWRAA